MVSACRALINLLIPTTSSVEGVSWISVMALPSYFYLLLMSFNKVLVPEWNIMKVKDTFRLARILRGQLQSTKLNQDSEFKF